MKEKEPVSKCQLCGYLCGLDSKSGGRFLEDLEGDLYFLPQKIEDCESRLILTSTPGFPKDVARGLIRKGRPLGE
jgi:hypothetical protein